MTLKVKILQACQGPLLGVEIPKRGVFTLDINSLAASHLSM